MRRSLGRKVETNPKAYTHKRKHPPKLDDDAEQNEALHKFLVDKGFYELFGGLGPEGGVK